MTRDDIISRNADKFSAEPMANMEREQIIRMAREAETPQWWLSDDALERFAVIVSDRMIRNGYRKCAEGQRTTQFCGQLESAVAGAVAAEREACAKIVDDAQPFGIIAATAAAIRARRKK